jgi:hypothetical protein
MNIIYTVCNRTNLAHALALSESVLRHQPDSVFYLCWVDNIALDSLPDHVHQFSIDEVNIPGWDKMLAEYYDFELLAACRPWFAIRLLELHPDCKSITFLAPTTLLLNSFDELLTSGGPVSLTPNIQKPLPKSSVLDDKRVLNVGMFHSGSWILKPSAATRKMLGWWAERTVDRAKFDLCNGMNMDQLWLNFVPVWVPDAVQIGHAGWHYGLHSVLNKELSLKNGHYLVNNQTLISVDFAGLDYFDPIWSNHTSLLSQNGVFKSLFNNYKKTLKTPDQIPVSEKTPGYGKLPDIRKNRNLRNGIAGKLKAITRYIEEF